MPCGLFGKLPSKRDFIVHNVPRPFLAVWETWLQSSVAASRVKLGSDWEPEYLTAPIWRFWIGSQVCGTSVAGVLMPSVDGVGRYFPLTLCACAPENMRINPPALDAMDSWYGPAEVALLRALDANFKDEPREILQGVGFPPVVPDVPLWKQPDVTGQAISVWTVPQDQIGEAFNSFLAQDNLSVYGERSYWWTRGGGGRLAQIVACDGLPDPYSFAGFLTGIFDGGAAT